MCNFDLIAVISDFDLFSLGFVILKVGVFQHLISEINEAINFSTHNWW
ncbi:hypothetical protein [Virgibacillus sp. Bac330]|nr:hypothetical protein [Virgibacillus sp. Bac330]